MFLSSAAQFCNGIHILATIGNGIVQVLVRSYSCSCFVLISYQKGSMSGVSWPPSAAGAGAALSFEYLLASPMLEPWSRRPWRPPPDVPVN